MTYRNQLKGCFLCGDGPVLERCLRCEGPLCLAHVVPNDQRCARCELDWTKPLQGVFVLGRWPLLLLIVALITSAFITFSVASVNYWSPEIEQIKWVGGAITVGIALLTAALQRWPSLRADQHRRRFLKERLALQSVRVQAPAAAVSHVRVHVEQEDGGAGAASGRAETADIGAERELNVFDELAGELEPRVTKRAS